MTVVRLKNGHMSFSMGPAASRFSYWAASWKRYDQLGPVWRQKDTQKEQRSRPSELIRKGTQQTHRERELSISSAYLDLAEWRALAPLVNRAASDPANQYAYR